jgi:hypothetical protein
VTINGLPLIFEHLRKNSVESRAVSAETVLKTVRIYHFIEPEEEAAYRSALMKAYERYCEKLV